jgi:2-amino-4-hydroxy-6-hydroxymethyldihydropteridine diphosphokinase
MSLADRPVSLACLACGSNIGDRLGTIREAVWLLRSHPRIIHVRVSPLIETQPIGPGPQSLYINGAISLITDLSPGALLTLALEIERRLGRTRDPGTKWGPRTLDLDLLIYGDSVIDEPGLTLPHPRLHERLFVLEPLATLVPEVVVPTLGQTVSALLDAARARHH